jgi:hypothetical protein
MTVSERAVTNLLDRYDELLAVALTDDRRLKRILTTQGKVVLALDGLQPDVGHEVLWVLRDCLSGEILLAKSLLSARQRDLAELLIAVKTACPVPIIAVVSDGQHSSRSYWPGLFHCYDTPDLPRTNNDLEQAFGSHRYHERRATGRKGASPALVLRGSARLVAGLGTRAGAGTAADLAGADLEEWKRVRAELEERRQRRVERRRFRRDPEGYLKALENQLIQSRLPA